LLVLALLVAAFVLFLWAFFDAGANIDGHPVMPLAFALTTLAFILGHDYVVARWRREP
jgi:hypothetical protein